MKKRFFAIFLTLCLALALLATTVFAETSTADLVIDSVEDFKAFFANCSAYNDKTVELDCDIDLDGAELPLGSSSFKGSFDGKNHTIKNFTIAAPLFNGHLRIGSVVKNLTVENVTLNNTADGQPRLGILCRNLSGTLENVHVKNCTVTSEKALGVVGGLAAMTQDNSTVNGCSVDTLTVHAGNGSPNIGGAFGLLLGNNVTVTNVTVSGDITVTGKGSGKDSAGKQVGMTVDTLWGDDRRGDNATVTGNSDAAVTLVTDALASVAKIGDTYYRTLYSAVFYSKPGDTVTVVKDIEIGLSDLYSDSTADGISYYTWVYVTGKDLTLDLNSHTIRIAESAKNKANSQYRLFLLSNDSNMTVTGNGKIVGDAGNPGAVNIFTLSKQGNSSGGCLTIENGEFSTAGAEIVYAFPTNHCEIKGGTFEGLGEDYSKNRALNCNGGGSTNNYAFSITGGTYVDFDPRNMDDGNLVADGYCVEESTRVSDDATLYTVAVCGESRVSEVTTQPTYTEEGERTYYCANCGKVMDTEPIEKRDPLPVIGALSSMIEDDVDFVDVSPRDYFYKAVCWAVRNDITTGTSRRYFSPDDACTRAQAVTFLWRAAGEPRANGTNPFSDVSVSDYYYEAVLWAVSEGIVKGTSDTTFSPDATCTRAQIVTMLYRAAGEPVGYVNAGFTDVASSAYYAEAVAWAVVEGITDGTSTTTFSPNATCTRAQIVTFLYRS